MISLIITQINRRSSYYFVKAINLDTENLKNSVWKLYTLFELFRYDNLLLYFLTGEKEQLYLKLPDNKKETLLRILTESHIIKTSFTSEKMIEDWKEVTTATITIKFL